MPTDSTGSGRVRPAPKRQYGKLDLLSSYWRLGRIRYLGYSFLFSTGALLAIGIATWIASWLPPSASQVFLGFAWVFITGLWIYLIVVLTIKRCHDFDASGWLSLLLLAPFGIFVFWLLPGTDGVNRYGRDLPPNTLAEKLLAFTAIISLVALVMMRIALA